jgi:oligopeptide transport system substrate-binding protein
MKYNYRIFRLLTLILLFVSPSLSAKAVTETYETEGSEIPEVFTIGTAGPVETVDPHYAVSPMEIEVSQALFPGLFKHSAEDGGAVKDLTDSWEVSEDSTVYIFHLKHAFWSDGVPITAHTAAESWLRILSPDSAAPYGWYPAMYISGAPEYSLGTALASDVQIKAMDDYTLYVGLSRPLPVFPELLTHHSFLVLPVHVIRREGKDWETTDNLVTSGPISLKHRSGNDRLTLSQTRKGYPAEIVIKTVPPGQVSGGYRKGETDWITHGVMKNTPLSGTDVQESPYFGLYFALFRSDTEPLNDRGVRKALARAIDRGQMAADVMNETVFPARGIIPEMEHYPSGGAGGLDLTAARQLLSLAGFPGGEDFPALTLLYRDEPGEINHRKIADYLAGVWKDRLGITVHPVGRNGEAYLRMLDQGRFDIALTGWYGDYLDPEALLGLFHSESPFNAAGYSNREFDSFLKEAESVLITEAADNIIRMRILKQAEEVLLEKTQGLIPLFYPQRRNLINLEEWGGWYSNLLDVHPLEFIYYRRLTTE